MEISEHHFFCMFLVLLYFKIFYMLDIACKLLSVKSLIGDFCTHTYIFYQKV